MNATPSWNRDKLLADSFLADFEHHGELDSTQDRAQALAADLATRLPVLIVADRQRLGRGRGGNSWYTGAGSLALSLAYDPRDWGLDSSLDPRRSLAAGMAVIDALAPWVRGLSIGLHWPNDVFCEGRKLAGILIDALSGGRIVLGIGINTNNTFDSANVEVRRRAISILAATGAAVDHQQLVGRLLGSLRHCHTLLSEAPASFGQRCQELCLQVGQPITLKSGSETVSGMCVGLAQDGAICLETPTGSRKFYSGVLLHDRLADA